MHKFKLQSRSCKKLPIAKSVAGDTLLHSYFGYYLLKIGHTQHKSIATYCIKLFLLSVRFCSFNGQSYTMVTYWTSINRIVNGIGNVAHPLLSVENVFFKFAFNNKYGDHYEEIAWSSPCFAILQSSRRRRRITPDNLRPI